MVASSWKPSSPIRPPPTSKGVHQAQQHPWARLGSPAGAPGQFKQPAKAGALGHTPYTNVSVSQALAWWLAASFRGAEAACIRVGDGETCRNVAHVSKLKPAGEGPANLVTKVTSQGLSESIVGRAFTLHTAHPGSTLKISCGSPKPVRRDF